MASFTLLLSYSVAAASTLLCGGHLNAARYERRIWSPGIAISCHVLSEKAC